MSNERDCSAHIIDPEAWQAIKDVRDRIVGSLWENRRLWALEKADAIMARTALASLKAPA